MVLLLHTLYTIGSLFDLNMYICGSFYNFDYIIVLY